MKRARKSALAACILGICALVPAPSRAELPAGLPSQPIPDPGRALAGVEDTASIAVNPANLAFLPGPELRWTTVWTSTASPLPARGHSIALGLPLWLLSTGLRVDLFDPPESAPSPFNDTSYWVRFPLSVSLGSSFAFGTTFGWGRSDAAELDDFFAVTTGLTWRPSPMLGISVVARDWNRPVSRAGTTIQRTYDVGLALRPFGGRRGFELGLETAFYEADREFVPKVAAGIDIPHVGRVRGDVALRDLGGSPDVLATVGLDVNFGYLQVSGGAVVGDAITRAGTGFYAGAAIRGFREPGIRMPKKVARIRLENTPGVRGHTRLLQRLWRLGNDPEVEGVLLELRAEPAASLAHAEEIGDAIRGIRSKGKKVFCHLEDAGGRSLFVCSQADSISMNPAGGLRFAGISSQYYYFGSLFKKLGVRAEFVRIGDHKLAAEQFARSEGSPIGQQDHQDLVNQFESIYVHDVGGGRRIPAGELKQRIAKGPFLAAEAKEAGLIDKLVYEDEINRYIEEEMGRPVRVADDDPATRAPERWGNSKKVALVYLSGDMMDGESSSIPFLGVRIAGSYTIARALKRAREDATVRAVVLRIATGGGSSLAADVILREAILTAKAKPLIVSMGSSAASGGYYAAVAGRQIYANRGTITGSIGIFYGKVDVSGLLQKLGVHIEAFRTSPRADAESFFRPFTDDERRELGVKVKQFYDLFIARVAEGRKMKAEEVDAVARGRVWTGAQAKERRLVDKLGGLRHALAEARELGGLPGDAPILELPEEDESLLGLLMSLAGAPAAAVPASAFVPAALLDMARALSPFMIFDSNKPLARSEIVEGISFGGPAPTVIEEP
ncbi:MAG: signal peptide peptidase SppA [Polyangiaceae bacterium]|nr:signal peptide peptidase SppA [Polyangiaceae bacterium]